MGTENSTKTYTLSNELYNMAMTALFAGHYPTINLGQMIDLVGKLQRLPVVISSESAPLAGDTPQPVATSPAQPRSGEAA